MFTGIIQSIGTVRSLEPRDGDLRLSIDAEGVGAHRLALERMQLGDSVAVAGVCLTVVSRVSTGFTADVSRETLRSTTIERWQLGEPVNLEAALRAGDAIGGHIVSGHIDGLAELIGSAEEARSRQLRFRAPSALARCVARKGSVALDGVSLTVNEVDGRDFSVNLIPHTLAVTTLGTLAVSHWVNFEIDVMARYAARWLEPIHS